MSNKNKLTKDSASWNVTQTLAYLDENQCFFEQLRKRSTGNDNNNWE